MSKKFNVTIGDFTVYLQKPLMNRVKYMSLECPVGKKAGKINTRNVSKIYKATVNEKKEGHGKCGY